MARSTGSLQSKTAPVTRIEMWPIARLVFYVRNPFKNDHVVDRMMESIHEFGLQDPGARS